MASPGSTCAACGAWVALYAAHPRVTADGRVVLECPACARGESSMVAVEAVAEAPPPSRGHRGWVAAIGAATLVGVFGLAAAQIGRPSPAAAVVDADDEAPVVVEEEPAPTPAAAPPVVAPKPTPVAAPSETDLPLNALDVPAPPIPERDGEPLDEWLPTLLVWVHPIPGSPDIIPRRASRRFGAHRDGDRPNQCGGGHCGVDLTGERGQTVVAVAWGTVLRINRDPYGLGGRYVRIEHPDDVLTTYFHLDQIAPDLKVGDEIVPGQPLGTVGKTGIHVSAPHLHFSLEIVDGGKRIFIDPAPFLARAQVLRREDVPVIEPVEEPATEAEAPEPTEAEAEPSGL